MTATSNKDFKMGWMDQYYPYNQYTVIDGNINLGGEDIKVDNEILTRQVIKESTSGFDSPSSINQTGGGRKKKYKIKANNIDDAFHKLEAKVNGGKGNIVVLQIESLDNKNNLNFIKIYRKKI